MRKKTIRLLSCLFALTFMVNANAQDKKTVSGKVVDEKNGPIAGASVSIKDGNTLGATDEFGNFSVSVSASVDSITIKSIGYAPQNYAAVGNISTVVLTPVVANANEVVVTALGIKKAPRALGYATSTIGAAELTKTGSPNVAGALYGKAPGVRISASPGGATSGININIRGTNSITGNSQPLIIINGVPMRTTTFNNSDYWSDQRARGNGLEDLNPEDIESLTILKGASAAALYGSEAMNGVVLITTKSGKGRDGFSVDFNGTYTKDKVGYFPRFQNVRGVGAPKSLSDVGQADDLFYYYPSNQAINGVTRGVTNQNLSFGPKFDGKDIISWDGVVRPYVAQNAYSKFFNNPDNTTFNIALGHSTATSNTRFSLTRQDNEMTSLESYNKKNIVSLNSSFKSWKLLTTDIVVNYVNQHTHNRPFMTDRLINNFTGMISTFDNPEWYINKYKTSLGYKYVTGTNASLTPDENLTYNGYKTDVLDYMWNTLAKQYDEYSNRFIGSFTNTLQFTSDFNVRARISADITSQKTDDKQPTEIPNALITNSSYTGYYALTSLTANVYYTDLLATYKKSLSQDLSLSAMAGYTATKTESTTQLSYTVNGLSVRDWFNINASMDQAKTTVTPQSQLRDALLGTLSMNYKDFWYIEGTLRRERISTMNPDNNVLYYPSVNSSLVLTDAFKLPEAINYAKLRASWGIVGNYPGIYQSALSYSQGTLGNQGTGTSVLYTQIPTSSYGNEKIKPEKKSEIEFGLETKFLNNRLGFDVTYYNGRINDQILNYTLPISMGASSILANVGSLRNSGWEFAITGTPIRNNAFTWNSTLNFSTNKNVVLSLPGGASSLLHKDYDGAAAQLVSRVGQPMGDIMVHPVATDANGNKIVSADGLYALDADNWIKAGNAMPKITGGFINDFSFKGFTASFLIDVRWGGQVMPTGINWMTSRGLTKESLNAMDKEHGGLTYYIDADGKGIATNGAQGPNGEKVYEDGMLMDGVLTDGTKNTNIISQAYYYNNTYNWGGPQYSASRYELYVKDNNYIKMREISIGYKIPKSIAAKVKAKTLQLSVFGRNLFFLYRTLKDLDPEQMTGGSNWVNQVSNAGIGPATRTFGVMLRASF